MQYELSPDSAQWACWQGLVQRKAQQKTLNQVSMASFHSVCPEAKCIYLLLRCVWLLILSLYVVVCVYVCSEEPPAPFLESAEDENHNPVAPSFSLVIQDVEVVEGSAARFDCKIEGNLHRLS